MLAITLASIAIAASSATAQAITAVPAGSFGNATCEATFSNVLAMYNKCGYTFNFSSNNPVSINGDPAAAIRCICAHDNLSLLDSIKTQCANVPQATSLIQDLPSVDNQCANIAAGSPIPSLPSGPITAVPSGSTLPQACQDAENAALQMYNGCGLSISATGVSYKGDETSVVKCVCKNKNMLSTVVSACSNSPGFSNSASSFQSLNQACSQVSSAERFSVIAGAAVAASLFLF